MIIKRLFVTTSMAVVGLVFVACSHDDFIDEDAPVKNLKAEYAANLSTVCPLQKKHPARVQVKLKVVSIVLLEN